MKRFIFFIITLVPLLCFGQFDLNKVFEDIKLENSETTLVNVSVTPELSVIRQQYRLLRDGKSYGKNHKPYFGESYSLGIKISNGLILHNSVVEPWANDKEYIRLNTSNQYTPELFRTFQRNIGDSVYNEVNLEFGTAYIHPFDSENKIYIHEEKKGDFGLSIDNSPGEKEGYMMWVTSENNLQDSTLSLKVKSKPMKIMASEDCMTIPLEHDNRNKVLGGLFVVPKYERGGRVLLQLVGVAVPDHSSNSD